MLLLSTRGSYGLIAMYEIYLNKDEKPIQIKEISNKTGISKNYLEQLLNRLRKADLISSVRGAHGGYKLSRNANEITIKSIFECLDGEFRVSGVKTNPVLGVFYNNLEDSINELIDVKLSSMEEYMQKYTDNINYSI
jgi:Rrf2 family protein